MTPSPNDTSQQWLPPYLQITKNTISREHFSIRNYLFLTTPPNNNERYLYLYPDRYLTITVPPYQ